VVGKGKNIVSLNQEDGVIEGDEDILSYATNFYKKYFWSWNCLSNVVLDVPMPCVLDEEDRKMLGAEFTLE
jgi:hypothetical protein